MYKPDKHMLYRGDMLMSREVTVENTTFIVNSYSGEDASESLEEILGRTIVQNAEHEF